MTEHIPERADELPVGATGTWRVYTRDSCHVFRLEDGTVTREPGPNTRQMFNDQPLPLRSIDVCRVGERGRWTMHTIGWSDDIDWYWVDTSVVRQIVKDDESELAATDHEPERRVQERRSRPAASATRADQHVTPPTVDEDAES